LELVGVAADIHEGGLAHDAVPEFYVPTVVHPPQTAYLVVRTARDPISFGNAIRNQVLAVDHDQAVSEIRTVETILDATLGQRSLTMTLLGVFAGVALLLAVVGIYGVIAYSVAQRTREVGIRRALGAQRADVLRLVLRQGLVLTLTGCGLGLAIAFGLTRIMIGLLFGISATDAVTFGAVAMLFVIVASIAAFIPAWRAARIDPMEALRIG
jgi:ABC-type antimicrobial peptide transport system permease subunit